MGPVVISAGQAKEYYYEKDPIFNADGKGENARWHGGGLKNLGLTEGDIIRGTDFEKVVDGQDLDGKQLVQNSYANDARTEHRAGLDFVFSDPKSVSYYELVAKVQPEVIAEAREEALNKVVDLINRDYIYYRQTENGETKQVHAPDQGIIAAFTHSTSRANDPNVHSHVIVANMVFCEDGKVRALSNEKLFDDQKYLNAVYHAEQANYLAKHAGFAIEPDGKGSFDIAGFDDGFKNHISSRRDQIANEVMAELRERYPRASEAELNKIAGTYDRPSKDRKITKEELESDWKKTTETYFASERDKLNALNNPGLKVYEAGNGKDYVRAAVKDLEATESVFKGNKVKAQALSMGMGKIDSDEVDRGFGSLRRSGELVAMEPPEKAKGIFGRVWERIKGFFSDRQQELKSTVFSTPEIIAKEKNVMESLREGEGKTTAIMDKEKAESWLKKYEEGLKNTDHNFKGFTDGQKELFSKVISSTDQFIVAQGVAGAGKTTVFKAISEAAKESGVQLEGYAKTGKAVQEFKAATEAEGRTVDSFLKARETGKFTVHDGSVRVIDEASMLGSKQTDAMIEAAKKDGTRLVLLGDRQQMQSIDAGRIFTDVQEKSGLSVVKMEESMRQKNEYTRSVVDHIKDKNLAGAKAIMEESGKVSEIVDRQDRLKAVAESYFDRGGVAGGTHIVTQTNKDRHDLNQMIRGELKARGELDEGQYLQTKELVTNTATAQRFASSYEVGNFVYAEAKAGGMAAGVEGRITAIDRENNTLTVEGKRGAQYEIELTRYGDKIQQSHETTRNFAQGDSIIFLKNDKGLDVQNGLTGTVAGIDEKGRMTVELEGRKSVTFTPNQYQYVDHAYAVTTHKSQGASYDKTIYVGEASRTNHNDFYTAASRSKHDFEAYVDNKERFFEHAAHDQEKTSTLDYRTDSDPVRFKEELHVDIKREHSPQAENQPQTEREPQQQPEKSSSTEMEM